MPPAECGVACDMALSLKCTSVPVQASARLLRTLPPKATVKLVWGTAYCQLIPPEKWLVELLQTADLQLRVSWSPHRRVWETA